MKFTAALLGEHGVFYAQFDHLERVVPATASLGQLQAQVALLAAALGSHARLENELLFDKLERSGPVAVMYQEHEQIESELDRARQASELEEAKQLVLHAIGVARDHFAKEEEVVFGLAEQTLGRESLVQLGAQWARARKVRL